MHDARCMRYGQTMDAPSDLEVVDIGVFAIRIPLTKLARMASSELAYAESVVVRLPSGAGERSTTHSLSAQVCRFDPRLKP